MGGRTCRLATGYPEDSGGGQKQETERNVVYSLANARVVMMEGGS